MPSTRDRLLSTANQLFYDHGVTATGVDAVVKAAGLTKPTLYAHFPSKTALLAAALELRHDQRRVELTEWLEQHEVSERPVAVFDWLGAWYAHDGARGCCFLNAAAELPEANDPARLVVQGEKRWLEELLTGLCRDAGLADPERLGSQLLLLVDGIGGRILVHGTSAAEGVVEDARQVAAVLTRTSVRPTS